MPDPAPHPALDIVAIPGSLRAGSYNRALARTLPGLLPDAADGVAPARIDLFELHDVPLYDGDLDNEDDRPPGVRALKARIDEADGVILVSPEYNYGVPGVMKNAIDWASRPGFRSPMTGKPTGIMGASAGASGTMRGQEQLKLGLLGMGAQVFPHPGVAVRNAGEKMEDGLLADESTKEFVREYLADYLEWVRRVAR